MGKKSRRRGARAFTLIELMIVVAIIGILAAVAIPAFMKYIRRSKTVEASMNLRRMFESASAYYIAEHASSSGGHLASQFPTTVSWQPALGTCAAAVGGKCTPNPTYWSNFTWEALNFSIDDPFYYSYQFTSGGVGSAATFTVEASGDLDGDSSYSLFRRNGSINTEHQVTGGAGLFTVNEIE